MNPRKEGKDLLSPTPYFVREIEREQDVKDLKLDQERAALEESKQSMRLRILFSIILTTFFGISLIFSLVIIILDSITISGFEVNENILTTLTASTIGEVAGLLLIAYRWVFRN
jgi:hypothetical protein